MQFSRTFLFMMAIYCLWETQKRCFMISSYFHATQCNAIIGETRRTRRAFEPDIYVRHNKFFILIIISLNLTNFLNHHCRILRYIELYKVKAKYFPRKISTVFNSDSWSQSAVLIYGRASLTRYMLHVNCATIAYQIQRA